MSEPMLMATRERRSNRAPWIALLLAIAAIALNVGFFFAIPGQWLLPWLSMLFALGALAWGTIGLRRAFGQPGVYGGKIASSIFGVLALLLCGLMAAAWFQARTLPASAGAPQVGQKAPDFTLTDTDGMPVSLRQLFGLAPAVEVVNLSAGNPPATKAVLLIFYRGYW